MFDDLKSPSLDLTVPFDGTDDQMIQSRALPRPNKDDPLEVEGFGEIYGYTFDNNDDRIPFEPNKLP